MGKTCKILKWITPICFILFVCFVLFCFWICYFVFTWRQNNYQFKFLVHQNGENAKSKWSFPGGVLQKNSYGDAQSRLKNFDHLYTSKSIILWPVFIPFFCKKHPIWGKLGAFLAKFSKIPILQIGRIGYVTITHPSIYQNLRKCTSKPLSIPVYHLSVRPPPPGVILTDGGQNDVHLCFPNRTI